MTWRQLGKTIDVNQERIVAKHAQTFHADAISAAPVDTGFFKGQWSIRKDGTTWIVTNSANYAGILWVGRVGNRGSLQLPAGYSPILKANVLRMERDLKRNLL